MAWTDEREDALAKLWQEGLSASQVAARLGGNLTRSAVLGKVHRLGIEGRAKPSRPTRLPPAERTWIKPAKPVAVRVIGNKQTFLEPTPRPSPVPAPETRDERPGLRTVVTLGREECKWPIGDPRDETFTLCGIRCAGTYCETHRKRAFQPAEGQKKPSANELARSLRRYI